MIGDIPQLNLEENEMLSTPFTEKEVFELITQMKHNKAPGPDEFPVKFYQKCWHIIKRDLMPMFHALFDGHLNLFQFWNNNVVAKEGESYSH